MDIKNMRRISVIISTLCLLGMTASYRNMRDTKKRSVGLSLVHLIRAKRFDFSMFGCADCRPVAYCRQDADCHSGYSCKFKCCALKCVRDIPSFRVNGNFRDNYQKNGQSPQTEEVNQRSSNGTHEYASEELNDPNVDVNSERVITKTTEEPARDVPCTSQKLEVEDKNARQTENDVKFNMISAAHAMTDVTNNIVTP